MYAYIYSGFLPGSRSLYKSYTPKSLNRLIANFHDLIESYTPNQNTLKKGALNKINTLLGALG